MMTGGEVRWVMEGLGTMTGEGFWEDGSLKMAEARSGSPDGCLRDVFFFIIIVWRSGAEGRRVGLKGDDAVGRVDGGGRR